MRHLTLFIAGMLGMYASLFAQLQSVQDDFEGNGTINTWEGDDCNLNTELPNPHQDSDNSSATVLEYHDVGGQFANARFDVPFNFDLSENHTFSLKIYVPSSGLTGSAPNQVSLKLQDGTLGQPWTTQSEVVKPIALDQWQTVTFDFANDPYINLDGGSPPPMERIDFNRVLLQVNGEDNNDEVLAYIDDFAYDGTIGMDTASGSSDFDLLVWSDEFDVDGPLDDTKWFHQTQIPQGNSWFNGEIQHYTDRIENTYVEDGIMYLVAKAETFTDQGVTKQHTSARLNSKFAFTYGRVEVRAKLPFGPGTWPAIWTLGKNITETGAYWQTQGFGTTSWPACGEMDIMEHWGTNQGYVSSATHTPSSFGGTINTAGQNISTVSTEFHVYEFEWTPEKLVFSVDGVEHFTYEPDDKNADTWPFDADQYLLLNVAILPSISPSFTESAMEVDYVRVYQSSGATNTANLTDTYIRSYPNPVQDVLTLELPQERRKTIDLKLLDLAGREIKAMTLPVEAGKVVLTELDSLKPGLYVVSFSWEGKPQAVRFEKE